MCRTGEASDFVYAAGDSLFGAVEIGLLQFVKGFDRANDGTMRIMNRNRADQDRNVISGLVMEKSGCLDWVACFHGASQGAFFVAKLAAGLLTMQQCPSDAGAADDFVAEMSGDEFRAVAPEDDLLLHVDDAHAG